MTVPVYRFDTSVGPDCVRYDLARFSPKTSRTPQGFLKAPALFTKVGVLEYTRLDGSKIRELRPEEEVFAPESLATLSGAPLVGATSHEQAKMVTPENAKGLAIGWVSEKVERQDSAVAGTLTIMDAETIAAVGAGQSRDISMGYKVRIDATPGVHPIHGPYDQIQRDIRYNHAALGGLDWGRAGSDIGLRLDSHGAVQRLDAFTSLEHLVMQKADLLGLDRLDLAKKAGLDPWDLDDALFGFGVTKRKTLEAIATAIEVEVQTLISLVPRVDRADTQRTTIMETIEITINGLPYTVPKAAGMAYQQEQARHDTAIAEITSERDSLQGKFDAQVEELKGTQTKLVEANDPARMDAAISDRIDLIVKARKVLGDDAEIKGTPREIQELVLRHDNKDLDLSAKSDDYVEARFDSLLEALPTETAPAGNLGETRADARKAAAGGSPKGPDAEASRLAMQERNANAWQQPLTVTTQPKA